MINLNDVVSLRDSIGKEFIPGRVENSYMITEKGVSPLHILPDGKWI